MDPSIGSALIQGGASLVGGVMSGLFGSAAQNDANRLSLQINRENNEFNAKQAALNRAFQERMYERSFREANEYNTPLAQRKRYEEAGINPFFLLGNVQQGNMQSLPSGASASSAGMPSIHAYDPTSAIMGAAEGIGNAVSNYFINSKLSRESEGTAIDNLTRYRRNIAEIDKMLAETGVSEASKQKLLAEKNRIEKLMDKEYELLTSETEISKSNQQQANNTIELQNLEREYKGLEISFQNWFNEQQKKLGAKELDRLAAIISFTRAQTASEYVKKVQFDMQNSGIKLDNDQKAKLNPLLVEHQRLLNRGQELENKYGNNPYTTGGRLFEQLRQDKTTSRSFRKYHKFFLGVPTPDAYYKDDGTVRW